MFGGEASAFCSALRPPSLRASSSLFSGRPPWPRFRSGRCFFFAGESGRARMREHEALVEWRSDGRFVEGGYSRGHVWRFDGGTEVRGSSSPHVVPEPMSDPAGVDPEEALVASASSCHMLWFLSLAQGAGLDVLSYSDRAGGVLGRGEDGRIAITR